MVELRQSIIIVACPFSRLTSTQFSEEYLDRSTATEILLKITLSQLLDLFMSFES